MMNWPKIPPKKIVVRMPNWLGDLVMGTPVLKDLRDHFPDASITAMCQGGAGNLLEHNPNINDIFSFKRPNGWIHHTHPYGIIETLKQREFDLGILLTNSFSSAWWFWLGDVRHRIGYSANMRSFLLDKAVPLPDAKETQHQVVTCKMLLAPLGIPVSDTPPKLYVSDEELKQAEDRLKRLNVDLQNDILIGINPGAAYGTAKCWLPERFEELTGKLLENPKNRIVYFGDPAGAPVVDQICLNKPDRVINLAGKTNLRELMALIKCCSIFLTNDSGPMHIADALGIPLVALFGSTSDVKTGPYSRGTVIHKHVECSPCYKRVCPIDFKCMKRIEVQEVYNELLKLMQ